MFRRMIETHNNVQAIMTKSLEQFNINFSIASIFVRVHKPDRVIENENNNYIIDNDCI